MDEDKINRLLEAERRGILDADRQERLNVARERGLVPAALPKEGGAEQKAPVGPLGYADDMAKSFGAGVVKGTIGMASLPNLLENVVDWAGEKVGYDISDDNDRFFPNYDEIKTGVESAAGTELYEPKYTPGKYSGTVGEFASGLLLPGGGGVTLARGVAGAGQGITRAAVGAAARKAAASKAKQVAAQGAKLLTGKGTSVVPAARIAQAIKKPVGTALSTHISRVAGTAPKPPPSLMARTVGPQAAQNIASGGSRVMATTIAPGMASEGAGQLTEGTDLEPWARLGGGILGGYLPAAAGRIVSPGAITDPGRRAALQRYKSKGILTGEVDEAATAKLKQTPAERAGIVEPAKVFKTREPRVTPGGLSGSKNFRAVEGTLEMVPGGVSVTRPMMNDFTAKALETAGIIVDPDAISRNSVINTIKQRYKELGSQFDDAERYAHVRRSAKADNSAAAINRTVSAFARNTTRRRSANKMFDEVDRVMRRYRTQGGLDGTQYVNIRRELSESADVADPQMAKAYKRIIQHLDDMVYDTLSKHDKLNASQFKTDFSNLRKEYRNLATIDEALAKAGDDVSEGVLTPKNMRQVVEKRARGARGEDYNDLKELVEDARQFYLPYSDSGSPARIATQNALAMMGATTVAGGVGGAVTGATPDIMAMWLAGGLAGPAVTSRVYASPWAQSWMTNQRAAPYIAAMKGKPLPAKQQMRRGALGSIAGASETAEAERIRNRRE